MTSQQEKEISEIKTLKEWGEWIDKEGITPKIYRSLWARDKPLADALHKKRFECLGRELKVAELTPEQKLFVENARKKKYDPTKKGFREIISEHNINK